MNLSKTQIIAVVAVAVAVAAGAAVVATSGEKSTYSEGDVSVVTPVDYNGNTAVQKYSKTPERVVIGCNTALDIFLHFGLGDKIVGIYYMEEAVPKNLETEYNKVVSRIGSDHILKGNISQTVLTSWEPDCIIGWVAFSDGKLGAPSYWNNLNCNVWSLRSMVDKKNMDGMKEDYENIGNVFDIKGKTTKFISDLEKKIEKVKPMLADKGTRYAMTDGVPRDTGFWMYSKNFINVILNEVGAANVFPTGSSKMQKSVVYNEVDKIDVLFIIVYGSVTYDNVLNHWKNDDILKTAPAIVNNKTYAVNLSIAYGADPTLITVIDQLIEALK